MTARDVLPGPGDIVAGKYLVEQFLGAGGMGVVVAARHLALRQRVAIKFLGPEARHVPSAAARFVREAQATAAIQSEHVARILDVGKLDDGAPYMVMEYLSGLDLSQHFKSSGPMSPKESADLIIQASVVVAEAHARSIVHRDLKPSNIFLTRRLDGSLLVKVLDFGLSKVSFFDGETKPISLTGAEIVIGSPHYMSPEQVQSLKNVDDRTDIWSLGVILYLLLTGVQPFTGRSAAAVCASVVVDTPLPVRSFRPELPESLETLVFACLEKAPDRRLQTVAELAAGLAPFASSESQPLVKRILGLRHGASAVAPVSLVTGTPRPSSPSPSQKMPLPSSPLPSNGTEPLNGEYTDSVRTIPLGTKRSSSSGMQEVFTREALPSEPRAREANTWDELADAAVTLADPTPPVMPEVQVTPPPRPAIELVLGPGAPDDDLAEPESVRLPIRSGRWGLGIVAIMLVCALAVIAVGAALRETPSRSEASVARPPPTGAPAACVAQDPASEPPVPIAPDPPAHKAASAGARPVNTAISPRPPPRPSQAQAKEASGAAGSASPRPPQAGADSARASASTASSAASSISVHGFAAAAPPAASAVASGATASSAAASSAAATTLPAPNPVK